MEPAVQVIQNVDAASALFSPARMRILEELAEPDTAAGIARRVGLPRQQVNYHVRGLEQAGLVRFVEERRKGNCVERVVRAAAQSYVVSPEALGKLGATPTAQRDRFSVGYLVALAARAIRDLAVLCTRAEKANKRIATMALEVDVRFSSAEARNAFAEEFAQGVAELAAKYHDASAHGGRTFRVMAGVYPAITKEEPTESKSINIQ